MLFKKTKIPQVYIIEPKLINDERGYFTRIFCHGEIKKLGLDFKIVQASQSLTKKTGTIRGMHFQKPPKTEDKIIQCLKGSIYDVVIDLRKNLPTYGQWVAQKLTNENKKAFLIPKGCAHGFQTLTDNCELLYFMSEYYYPEYASGVRWDDLFFNIKWPIKNPILSKKDKTWPPLL